MPSSNNTSDRPTLRTKGAKVYSRDLAMVGITTGSHHRCPMAGCMGDRISVKWPDGHYTFPCSRGIQDHVDGYKIV